MIVNKNQMVFTETRKYGGAKAWIGRKIAVLAGLVSVLLSYSTGYAACGSAPTVPPTLAQGLAYYSLPAPNGAAIVVPTFDEAYANLVAYIGPVTQTRHAQCDSILLCTQFWTYIDQPRFRTGVIFEIETLVQSCPSGYKLVGFLCEQIVPDNFMISLQTLNSPAANLLAEVAPSTSELLRAVVKDCNGVPVNAAVRLELQAVQNSGGHQHGDNDSPLRTGMLVSIDTAVVTDQSKVLTGSAPASGLRFGYNTPEVSGNYRIVASCTDGKHCTTEGSDMVWVGVKELFRIQESNIYRLIGDTSDHPDNHYLISTALNRLTVLSALYHDLHPDSNVLHLNDASLERGGVFDINLNWKSPHFEHCHGTAIDIRANGVDSALDITSPTDMMIKRFQELASMTGASALWDIPKDKNNKRRWDLRHFHIRLMGQEGLQCP